MSPVYIYIYIYEYIYIYIYIRPLDLLFLCFGNLEETMTIFGRFSQLVAFFVSAVESADLHSYGVYVFFRHACAHDLTAFKHLISAHKQISWALPQGPPRLPWPLP